MRETQHISDTNRSSLAVETARTISFLFGKIFWRIDFHNEENIDQLRPENDLDSRVIQANNKLREIIASV